MSGERITKAAQHISHERGSINRMGNGLPEPYIAEPVHLIFRILLRLVSFDIQIEADKFRHARRSKLMEREVVGVLFGGQFSDVLSATERKSDSHFLLEV